MPKQPVASGSSLQENLGNQSGECVPVGGVRTVIDPKASGVHLVDQSPVFVQTGRPLHIGATDASERTGQVNIREVGSGQATYA